jgi:hypothetical protein
VRLWIAQGALHRRSDESLSLSLSRLPEANGQHLSRSGLKLHLSEHHGDACPGATVFIWMRGIADYHRELTAKDYRYAKPGLEKAPWDAWVMEVGDPFGNRLRFSEPFKADDPRA